MTTRSLAAGVVALALALTGCGVADGGVPAASPALTPVLDRAAETTTATVTRVVDGDTVVITGGRKIRLLAIDTPETVHPHKPVQCWGPQASAFAKTTLLGRQVEVVTDPTQDETDRYGRTLADLVRADDGFDYSVEAARAGVARAYRYGRVQPRIYPRVVAAQAEAQAKGAGLWTACAP